MEAKKVYVIVGKGKTIKDVRHEILIENYQFEFHFGRNSSLMEGSDEVWVFGDCKDDEQYLMAQMLGCDIWNM